GAVQVGPDDVAGPHALEPVGPVVAVPAQDPPERHRRGPQVGAPAVVLEAGQHPRPGAEVRLDRDVSDQARAGLAHGLEVGEAQALDPALAELVAVAEELVAAADGQEHGAVRGGRRDRLALGPPHVLGHQRLVAVLPAADVEQVVGRWVEALAGARRGVREADPAPFAAAAQEDDVAAVGVDVHLLRVEGQQAQLHQPALPSTTTVEPTWLSPAGTSIRSRAASPQPAASASSEAASSRSRQSVWTLSLSSPEGDTTWRSRRTSIAPSAIAAPSGRLE